MRWFLLGLALLCACEQPKKPIEPKKTTLRIGLQEDPVSLDPRLSGSQRSQVISYLLFDGLMRIGEDGKAHLALAKEMTLSKDGKVYTFQLKETLWSTGDPLTAQDVAYSWERAMDPDFHNPYADRFNLIDSVEAVNEKFLVVTLKHPAPYFPQLLASSLFFPVSSFLDKMDAQWSTKNGVVSNGPFRLKKWEPGGRIQLEKNPYYWEREVVTLEAIDLLISEDPQVLKRGFEEGHIDWLGEPLASLPDWEEVEVQSIAGVYRLHFNVENEPFTSSKIRKAFAYALDRPTLVDDITSGKAGIATSLLPPNLSFGGDALLGGPSRADAQVWFEQGLQDLQIARKDFPPVILTYRAESFDQRLAQQVQQQWQEVLDVEVKLEGYETSVYRTNLMNHSFQIAGATWFSWFEDPIYTLEQFKFANNSLNVTAWEDIEYRALLDASNEESNPDVRNVHLKKAEALIMNEMPAIPVFVASYHFRAGQKVDGVITSTSGHIDFKYARKYTSSRGNH